MKKVGFVLKGQTFLRAVGTLIHFSNRVGIRPVICAYRKRHGKTYDNINFQKVSSIWEPEQKLFDLTMVDNDKQVTQNFKSHGVQAVICQDANNHFPFLIPEFDVFSIALFFDTIHYAFEGKPTGDKHRPRRTYFATRELQAKFLSLASADKWDTVVCGSPTFDHSLFVQELDSPYDVVFLAPPSGSIKPFHEKEINRLIDFCEARGLSFVLKDRAKSPWRASKGKKYIHVADELGFPYTSMDLLVNSRVHITAYGTSVFESNFLGKPAVNLPAVSAANARIPGFGFDHLYDNGLCLPASDDLIRDVDQALKCFTQPQRNITLDDNFSLDILDDILKEI